ncbi:GTPase [Thiolapillus sp.]|uniref:GTPase n=1 Tax=Thiolapillus sp. TaxID=2017437 RepID=UPI003AF8E2E6
MDYECSDLIEQAREWAEQALQDGWISEKHYQALQSFDSRTPDSLFTAGVRPLVVAFFGGTGVGKSTLINRLAGRPIARTGVERPTSREVTLYHHRSVSLNELPEDLPLDKIKMARHDDDRNSHVIWIDMPDMDSTEEQNKQLVLQWLPHIDVLIYVVNPERYKDNKAWRLLLAEGGRHAWLFVLNQWDKGEPAQYDDFLLQLGKAGFDDPIVMRTVCAAEENDAGSNGDEFQHLYETIQALANSHTIEQLELRGMQLRKKELQKKLASCLKALGEDAGYEKLRNTWEEGWQEVSGSLQKGLAWPLQRMAAVYTDKESHLLEGLFKEKDAAELESELRPVRHNIWDEWAQSRFEDALDEVVLAADQYQLPVAPLKTSLSPLRGKAAKIIHNQLQLAVRQALANPGNKLQRVLLKLSGFCMTFLPLLATGWVAYQVLDGYYHSNLMEKSYLGVNFAVHSILLILISWLLPFLINRQVRPSMEKVALQGLKKGLATGIAMIDAETCRVIAGYREQRQSYADRLLSLMEKCATQEPTAPLSENGDLSRMLIEPGEQESPAPPR